MSFGASGDVMQSGTGQIQTQFLHAVPRGAHAEQVAEVAVSIWREIDAALAPIIGQSGVAALLGRSQYLVRAAHPWLGSFQHETPSAPALDALHSALSSQSAEEATQGNAALLQVFHDLLASLIGASLCERLLRSVCPPPSSGQAAQDAP